MKNRTQKFQHFVNRLLVILLILSQVAVFFYLILSTTKLSEWVGAILRLLSFLVVLHIMGIREKAGFKLTWIVLVLLFPVFGGISYLFFHLQATTLNFRRSITKLEFATRPKLLLNDSAYQKAIDENEDFSSNIFYLQQTSGFPVFDKSESDYLSPGEVYFARLCEELKKAEKYIFIETFIIDDGFMWNGIYEILKEKAKNGVDVRIIYDDVGSFLLHDHNFARRLRSNGIKCIPFNRFKPFFLVSLNHRDHRKIAVIDGKVGFTGGINIADEYINMRERFGYWKDSAVMISGQAAWNLSVIFLQLWNFSARTDEDFSSFFPWHEKKCQSASDGFIQPFADSPTDNENVAEHVYIHFINNAKDYLYIETPYFIVDDSFVSALILAAKSGVDVRLILPHKWDKKLVRRISRSYYRELTSGGVRVFEYLPGFMHSKVFLSDDKAAVIGSINLDYRSLYHHFECGTCLYKTSSIKKIRSDFDSVFADCKEIRLEDCSSNPFVTIWQSFLRIIAPIM